MLFRAVGVDASDKKAQIPPWKESVILHRVEK